MTSEEKSQARAVSQVVSDPEEAIRRIAETNSIMRREIAHVIVGQDEVIEEMLIAIFCRGHAIVEGVPGLAKTLLISTIARTMNLGFNRIQFTPDLMPTDITGTEVIDEDPATGRRSLRFVRGPVFSNVILADEINRTPPKTQAALLEAMQERQVTVGGHPHPLPHPFFVLATQNPIEQEGTYPLPEAQLDRFMFMIRIGYPTPEQEVEVIKRTTASSAATVSSVIDAEMVEQMHDLVRQVPVADHVLRYALSIVRSTRVRDPEAQKPKMVMEYLSWGAGPRASQYLVLAAKAKALLSGSTHVKPEHIRAVAKPVLRHRIITNFNAEADGVTTDHVIDHLIETTPVEGTDNATKGRMDTVMKSA